MSIQYRLFEVSEGKGPQSAVFLQSHHLFLISTQIIFADMNESMSPDEVAGRSSSGKKGDGRKRKGMTARLSLI